MGSEPRAHIPTPPPFLRDFPSSLLRDPRPASGAPRATLEPDVASRKKHGLRFPRNGEDGHQIKGLAGHLKLVALILAILLLSLSHGDVLHPLWNSQPNTRVVHLFWRSPKEAVLVFGPVLRMVGGAIGHLSAHSYPLCLFSCTLRTTPHLHIIRESV